MPWSVSSSSPPTPGTSYSWLSGQPSPGTSVTANQPARAPSRALAAQGLYSSWACSLASWSPSYFRWQVLPERPKDRSNQGKVSSWTPDTSGKENQNARLQPGLHPRGGVADGGY